MPKIVSTSAFNVTLDTGEVVAVPAGESEQPENVAKHWFTVAHLVGTPKGRLPVVEGADGLMIEVDEAGQRVHDGANLTMNGGADASLRQEGPLRWSTDNPVAIDAARTAAEDADTEHTMPVDGKAAARQLGAEKTNKGKPAAPPAPTPQPPLIVRSDDPPAGPR